MKRSIKTIIIGFGITALTLGTLAACGHKYKDPEAKAEWFTEKVASKLDLNEDQRQKLDEVAALYVENRKERDKYREKTRDTIIELSKAESFDQQKAMSLVQERSRITEEYAPKMVNAYAEFHNMLNAEQRAEITEHLSDHFDHHHHWGHRCCY
jgi:Spy/CpxP family protein refolding chaperone